MVEQVALALHIPEGINFLCSGCGNCCLSWPVPVTDDDVTRISRLTNGEAVFKQLPARRDERIFGYTHSLQKRSDGRCAFLTDDNRCRLHVEFGASAKPAMCRLFPYSFTPTPSGIYTSVSFASSAVLFNAGPPLTEQKDLLEEQWQLFQGLMPDYAPDWSSIQLIDGTSMSWAKFLELDAQLTALFADRANTSLFASANKGSDLLRRMLPNVDLDKNHTATSPKVIDQVLIASMMQFYFPADVFTCGETDLNARHVAANFVQPPRAVHINCGGALYVAGDFAAKRLKLADSVQDLLRRFVYCRLFSKLYFGTGFNGLSLTAGYHHLLFLTTLVCLQLKSKGVDADRPGEQFQAACELVRILERRLTLAAFSRESTAMLEVLFTSPARLDRIISLAR